MYFSIKYRNSDILLKKQNFIIAVFFVFFCFNRTCYCVDMVSVTSASHTITSVSRYITPASSYHPRYQSRSSMYIRGLIPWNFQELAEAVLIEPIIVFREHESTYFIRSAFMIAVTLCHHFVYLFQMRAFSVCLFNYFWNSYRCL